MAILFFFFNQKLGSVAQKSRSLWWTGSSKNKKTNKGAFGHVSGAAILRGFGGRCVFFFIKDKSDSSLQ